MLELPVKWLRPSEVPSSELVVADKKQISLSEFILEEGANQCSGESRLPLHRQCQFPGQPEPEPERSIRTVSPTTSSIQLREPDPKTHPQRRRALSLQASTSHPALPLLPFPIYRILSRASLSCAPIDLVSDFFLSFLRVPMSHGSPHQHQPESELQLVSNRWGSVAKAAPSTPATPRRISSLRSVASRRRPAKDVFATCLRGIGIGTGERHDSESDASPILSVKHLVLTDCDRYR